MPDENQDQPLTEEPTVEEPTPEEPTPPEAVGPPPWQPSEKIKPEEEWQPQPRARFEPPRVEEIKEEEPPIEEPSVLEVQPIEAAPVEPSEVETFPTAEPTAETPPVTPPEVSPTEEVAPEEPTPEEVAPVKPLPPEPMKAFHAEGKSPLGAIKKIITILLVLIVIAGLAFAIIKIALPRLQKPKEVTLTYWGLWEPDTVTRQVIADWNKTHPDVKINYSMQSIRQYRERLTSALAQGTGPDIFRYHITWVPMLKNQLDSLPAEVMSTSEFKATFYPVAETHLRSGANYIGIPLEVDTLALFYNKNIFQAAGKTPPTTWDDLRTLATELTTRDEAGRIQISGVALGTTNNVEHWSDILGLMMLQNETDLANPIGDLAEDAVTFYTIFNRQDRVWDLTLPNSTLAFANGKLAMYFGYSWDVFEIKRINPDLQFGIVKAPQVAGSNINWASFWVEGVNNKSENKKMAWEFLKYLSTKETLTKLYQAQSQIRLFGEPYSRVDMAEQAKRDPLVAPFIEQASQAQTWYLCSRTFDNGINDTMIGYFKDAVNAVNANEDPARVLATAASGVAQLLSRYGIATMITR